MQQLEYLWHALEERPRLRGVRQELKDSLGSEYDAAARFLCPSGEEAARYPCPFPSGPGCPRHIIKDAGSIRAVCGCTPKECSSTVLMRDDTQILQFDNARCGRSLQQLLGVLEATQDEAVDHDIVTLGIVREASSRRLPVVLLMPSSGVAAQALTAKIERKYRQGAILLTPTEYLIDPGTESRLLDSHFRWLTLSELLFIDGSRLVAPRSLPEILAQQDTPVRGLDGPPESLFRQQQDSWLLSFGGKQARAPHSVGMGYLAEVLRSPGREIEALALAGKFDRNVPGVDVGGGIEVADKRTIREAKKLLKEREAELQGLRANDWPRKGELEEEIAKIKNYLQRAERADGKIRKAGGQVEKARKAVWIAIQRARDDIQERHPQLAQHVKDSVRTGTKIVYLPKSAVSWDF